MTNLFSSFSLFYNLLLFFNFFSFFSNWETELLQKYEYHHQISTVSSQNSGDISLEEGSQQSCLQSIYHILKKIQNQMERKNKHALEQSYFLPICQGRRCQLLLA